MSSKVLPGQPVPVAQAVAIPIAMAIPVLPVFAAVPAVALPAGFGNTMTPQIWGILQASKSFTVRQNVKLLPKRCCSCPPCVKQENTYSIYSGIGENPQAQIFRADEISNDWNRCCCAPTHPLKLEVRQYLPTTADLEGSHPDWNDISQDWGRFSGSAQLKAQRDAYKQVPVALTMVRDGTQFPMCCNKCVGCCICTTCCADGFTLVAGATSEEKDTDIGANLISNLDPAMTIGSGQVPTLPTAWHTPRLDITEANASTPFAKIEGPCCFGGCSEFCFDFHFPVSKFDSATKTGDLAKITKQKPKSILGAVKEALTDSDVYTIEFTDPTLSANQKALFLSGLLLNDYTYFEKGDADKCGTDNDGNAYINLCNLYCCGMSCPFKFTFSGGEGG